MWRCLVGEISNIKNYTCSVTMLEQSMTLKKQWSVYFSLYTCYMWHLCLKDYHTLKKIKFRLTSELVTSFFYNNAQGLFLRLKRIHALVIRWEFLLVQLTGFFLIVLIGSRKSTELSMSFSFRVKRKAIHVKRRTRQGSALFGTD